VAFIGLPYGKHFVRYSALLRGFLEAEEKSEAFRKLLSFSEISARDYFCHPGRLTSA